MVTIDSFGYYETRATNGSLSIGGVSFDCLLYSYCVDHLKDDCFDITSQPIHVKEDLYKKCQLAKLTLSTEEDAKVVLNCGDNELYEVPISRNVYESLIADKVNETIKFVKLAIKEADMEESEIHEIVLIGGSTLTPLVRKVLTNTFGNKLNTSVKPYEAGKKM